MNTYNTYQEAKIANPDSGIYKAAGVFGDYFNVKSLGGKVETCNPADYCMTVDQFLKDGRKFVDGDLILDEGVIWTVSDKVNSDTYIYTVKSSNKPDVGDNNRYILRAAALEEKKPRTKVEYVKCDLSLGDFIEGFRRGLLFYYQGGEYCQIKKENQAMFHAGNDSCFVKKETPMTEREALIDEYDKLRREFAAQCGVVHFSEFMADSGKFKLVN